MYSSQDLYDFTKTQAGEYLSRFSYPWEALEGLSEFIQTLGRTLSRVEYEEISDNVWVHKSAEIAVNAYLGAPCIVGVGTQVRQGAYIRGSALIGKNCVVGNSVEVKNAILFDGVQVPHYNYVGDSVLGYKAHMGAGAVTSNVKSDKTPVTVVCGEERIATGRKKVGAFLGDFAEAGCNSVLCPGSVLGRGAQVYPLTLVRGTVPENYILKTGGVLAERRK